MISTIQRLIDFNEWSVEIHFSPEGNENRKDPLTLSTILRDSVDF